MMIGVVVCAVVAFGSPAQASRPGPSAITYEPALTISAVHLRTMKHYGWDVHNVTARPTKISRAQAIAIVNGSDLISRVTEAALTRVTTLDMGKEFFDRAAGSWSIHPTVDHKLMWAIVTVTKVRSAEPPGSLGGPLIVGPDPRTVTKVNPLTGDVVLPPAVLHPLPLHTWTYSTFMVVDPETGGEPAGMSL
ncbi:MAG: hypothetical protein JWQ70_161 [Aeromicrobium sp.]|nr:hypothetical protein [Aeromicrobium sp.]